MLQHESSSDILTILIAESNTIEVRDANTDAIVPNMVRLLHILSAEAYAYQLGDRQASGLLLLRWHLYTRLL